MGSHKNTLLLPSTTLPIQGNLPANEPARYESWWTGDVYGRMKRDGQEPFILHDGPPYANGSIHIGHALNKILKDFAVKFQYFNGRAVEFVPGWDCHGLPIEQKAKQLYPEHQKVPYELRRVCRQYAQEQVEVQRKQFKSLGVVADWDNPYMTMERGFESMIYRRLCELQQKGLIEQRNKPVYWSWAEKTALSEAEIEYKRRDDTSVYVVFKSEHETFPGGFLVWTTTPWTLPANVAIAIHPDIVYVGAKVEGFKWPVLIQEGLFDTLKEKGIAVEKRGEPMKGSVFQGWKVWSPVTKQLVPVVMWQGVKGMHHGYHGTGIVHIAPGHGDDDYMVGLQNNLPMVMPVGPDGIYTEGKYIGHFVFDANKLIVEDLKQDGLLSKEEKTDHDYPHCWRSGTPIIYRATPQTFLKLGNHTTAAAALAKREGQEAPPRTLRDNVWEEIDNVEFFPSAAKNRMKPMLTLRPDWCLSRQRVWGVPVAYIRNKQTGEWATDPLVVKKTQEVLDAEGIDVWSLDDHNVEYFNPFLMGGLDSTYWEKIPDILDVWFDSGLTWSILNGRQADLYLEGNDQHRGWFQSSLWLSVALTGKAPYKKVITHGFIVDAKGEKMSKQKGNVVDPNDVVSKYGAEVLRYWVASSDYTKDATVGEEILKRAAEGHKKLRNTFRFLLGNLQVPPKPLEGSLMPVDRWILDRAKPVFDDVHKAFGDYEYYKGLHKLTEFVNTDLNAMYFNAVKDRLYCEGKDSHLRNSCVCTLTLLLESMLGLVAPLFTYTADEVFSHAPEWFKKDRKDIFDVKYTPLEALPKYEFVNYLDDEYWREALDKFHVCFDKLKTAGKVKDTLEVNIEYQRGDKPPKRHFFAKAEDWFVVSGVTGMMTDRPALAEFSVQGDSYRIVQSPHEKCERCWKRNGKLCHRCGKVLDLQPN